MMRNLGKLFLTLCLLTVGGGVIAKAQSETGSGVQANVPFDFAVGNTTLPAGKYDIRRLEDTMPNLLELRSANGRTTVVFETESAQPRGGDEPANKTELVFNKVGDHYFLSQMWVAGDDAGNQVPQSRMEKRLLDGGGQSEKHSIVGFIKRLKR